MLTRVLAVSTVVLLALVTHQYREINGLHALAAVKQAQVADETRQAILLQVSGQAPEVQRTTAWLHEFYKSELGLKRPAGLWMDGHPDYEGISTWVFQVYLSHRLQGKDEVAAREAVQAAIESTDEWKAKHRR